MDGAEIIGDDILTEVQAEALEPRDRKKGVDPHLAREIHAAQTARRGPGRPRKIYKQIAAVVAFRLQGYTNAEIERLLSLKRGEAGRLVYQAQRMGGFSDALERVDGVALPQAIENLISGLKKGDKIFTLETLKGRGVFRNHSQVKSDGGGGGGNTLMVKIEMPQLPDGSQAALPQIAVGQIVGKPRIVGEITEGQAVPDAVQERSAAAVDARQ